MHIALDHLCKKCVKPLRSLWLCLPLLPLHSGQAGEEEVEKAAANPTMEPRPRAVQLQPAEHVGRGQIEVGHFLQKDFTAGVLKFSQRLRGPLECCQNQVPLPGLGVPVLQDPTVPDVVDAPCSSILHHLAKLQPIPQKACSFSQAGVFQNLGVNGQVVGKGCFEIITFLGVFFQ